MTDAEKLGASEIKSIELHSDDDADDDKVYYNNDDDDDNATNLIQRNFVERLITDTDWLKLFLLSLVSYGF